MVTKADSTEPEPVQAVEKKSTLGEVHLAAPKIAQKRTVQAGAAPDAGVLSEEQPADSADSLGGLAVASNQPASPAAPLAVGGDVKQAKLISSVQPAYPAMAKTEHISGAVAIDALTESGALLQGPGEDPLERELNDVTNAEAVEAELAALRRELEAEQS